MTHHRTHGTCHRARTPRRSRWSFGPGRRARHRAAWRSWFEYGRDSRPEPWWKSGRRLANLLGARRDAMLNVIAASATTKQSRNVREVVRAPRRCLLAAFLALTALAAHA